MIIIIDPLQDTFNMFYRPVNADEAGSGWHIRNSFEHRVKFGDCIHAVSINNPKIEFLGHQRVDKQRKTPNNNLYYFVQVNDLVNFSNDGLIILAAMEVRGMESISDEPRNWDSSMTQDQQVD